MAVESSRSIGPAAGAAASGLDLSSLSAGRQVEARVTALAGQMATLATRHGSLEVDLGKAKVAVGDVLRFEVQAVPGGDGKSGIRLELMPSEQQTATQAAQAPAVDPARAALGRAVARAVTTQSGLGPLYGALTGLANAPAGSVPDPIRSIVDQILGGRLAASEPVSASSVAAAFRNSGLFSESTRAAAGGATVAAGDPDLKAAFTSLRDALAKWVGNAAPAGASGAGNAAGASTPGAAAGQAGAAAGRPATGEMPASSSGLAVRAAYGGAAQAVAAGQAPTTGQTQTSAATPGQPQARPATTPDAQPDGRGRLAAAAYGVPSPAARVAAPPVAGQTPTVATPGAGQGGSAVPTPQGAVTAPAATVSPTPAPPSAAGASVTSNPVATPAGATPPAAPTVPAAQAATIPTAPGAGATVAAPAVVEASEMPAASPQAASTTTTPPPSAPSVPSADTPVSSPATAPAAANAASPPSATTPGASGAAALPATPVPSGTAPAAGQAAAHGPVAIAGPSGGVMLIREGAQQPQASAEAAAKSTAPAHAGVVVVPPAAEGDEQALAAAFRLVRAVVADLGLAEGAADEAASLGAAITASPRERAGKVPPPRKGALPIAQDPAVGERADTAEAAEQLARKTLERADGALQRILLEQWAVLDTSGEAAASVQRGGKEWTAELPLATRDGTSIVQMTVERDGKQGGQAGETAKVGWRVRFALDVEPIGPVHAQIGLSGEHLSVGLWIERREMAEKLAADIGSLTSALADGGSVLEAVHVTAGEPPATRGEAQSTSGHFIDVSL